jgi:hypothetical protein
LLQALLVLGAAAAMIGLPGVAASAAVGASPQVATLTSGRPAAPLRALAAAAPASQARPVAPGGVCQVPGIGDLGGLLGFCTAGSSGLIGDLNNICQPSVPTPEPATGGIDSLIRPPATRAARPPATLYDSYGMAGQSWAAYDLQCSDMASLIGNNVAGVVFDAAKAVDRVTITVYQSAAGNGILSWLTTSVDKLVSALGNAIYFPYLAPVVILAAIWLAWHGLIRRRATRTIEGTLWMVLACATAVWLIGRPADFTGFGQTVSNGITQTLNVAFAKLPAPVQNSCVPVGAADPQAPAVASYTYTSGNGVVDTNANELWTVLVCKPWLDGEFGTTAYAASAKGHKTAVNTYGRDLLWAQAIAANEKPTSAVIAAKQNAFAGIAASIKQRDPAVYPLFTGRQWTTRLEIAFAALFAALVAGVLVLLIAITLIVLKLGFLLLLVAGPFFLIVGTHPGFGRVVATRWGELLIGVLLKQAAVALVLSVLLYAYSLIMGTSDAVLPWALKILMISLVTITVFIYRKPFTHLFSAVGYGVIGSRERADTALARAAATGARNTLDAATVAIPGFAAYRAARWARRNPAQAAGVAAQLATAAGAGGLGAAAAAGSAAGTGGTGGAAGPGEGEPAAAGAAPAGDSPQPAGRGRLRGGGSGDAAAGAAGTGAAPGRTPPPLDLPRRGGGSPPPLSGWARGGAVAAGRPRDGSGVPNGNGASGAGAAGAPAGNGWPQAAPRSARPWSNGARRETGNGGSRPAPAAPHGNGLGQGTGGPWRGPWNHASPPAGGAQRAQGPERGHRPAARPGWPAAPRPAWPATRGVAPPRPGRDGAAPPPPADPGRGASPAGAGPVTSVPHEDGPAGPFWLRPLRRRK